MTKEVYLGDGAYARFDGFQIWVRADRDGRRHEVALEPEAFAELVRFEHSVRSAQNTTTLSATGSAAFVEAIVNPPQPNDALKEAAARYRSGTLEPS